jgi:hypothetical protein
VGKCNIWPLQGTVLPSGEAGAGWGGLDADGFAWLKKDGQGVQTRANQMLRERMLKDLEGR